MQGTRKERTCARMIHPAILLSWLRGSYKSPCLGHEPFPASRTWHKLPSRASYCPIHKNKAAGVEQRTSFAYFPADKQDARDNTASGLWWEQGRDTS